MSSLVVTLTETLRYRGAIGQWSWVLHRLTGLGVVLFLVLHVIDTSWAFFYPELYEIAIASYQSPLFTIGEFGLVFAVVYHAYNGLRISIFDYNPRLWRYQQRAAWIVVIATIVTLVPTFALMISHVVKHYSEENVFVLPLDKVIREQLPFAVGIAAAVVAAVLFSGLAGLVLGSGNKSAVPAKAVGSRAERFWWAYMRTSGLLIVPLVFGHLAMMHVISGVFDLTVSTGPIIGTDLVNNSGTAVEFVAGRWNYMVAGVAIWKVYDAALLLLVTAHGFNGLRYVLTDYTMENPLLRRASVYLCLIGGVTLLIVGMGALLGSINEEAIQMAIESACEIGKTLDSCP